MKKTEESAVRDQRRIKVTMMLADSAQVSTGKLYILGGGWSLTGPNPIPSAVAIKIEVPRMDRKHNFKLALLNGDSKPVKSPDGKPIEVTGEFEAGIPPGLKAGTPLDVPLAFNFGPIQLTPDERYSWRLSIDGKDDPDWEVSFTTRPAPKE